MRLGSAVRDARSAPRTRFARGSVTIAAAGFFAGFAMLLSSAPSAVRLSPRAGDSAGREENQMKHSAMAVVSVMSAISSLAATQLAPAQAVEWRVADGGNGHWYAGAMPTGVAISWSFARDECLLQGGYLACISSAAENGFVAQVVASPDLWTIDIPYCIGPWLGGFQPPDAVEPAGGWSWVSGDAWGFQNWWLPAQEPNDGCGGEDYLHFLTQGATTPSDWWNDGGGQLCPPGPKSFVAEWSADCNNDGIVDYGQIKRGELPDYNGNNIPDCCEQGSACVVGSYPVQWRVADGGNGHWYLLDSSLQSWRVASTSAALRGGHLATITTPQEQTFVSSAVYRVTGFSDTWLGAERPDCASPFTWVTGESFNGAPSGTGFDSDCLGWAGPGTGNFVEHVIRTETIFGWETESDDANVGNYSLVEWSADCNNDGIVDFGQILNGTLADANANGVPDTCESIFLVPSQYPTIQAAINAVPTATQRTVQVAAGTYHESFALNGKDVIVRGAANNATILDGAGLAASIATLSGNEPATAGLEQLVFRNATVGTRIYPKALFRVGGAVYGLQSSAFIRSCRFESNRSDYGGGAYLLYCNMLVENCVFTQNTGVSQGGGLMTFGTTGTVRNCAFTDNRCGVAGAGSGSGFKSAGARIAGETVLLTDCTFTGGIAPVSGAAVEHYENTVGVPGILRISGCTITGNSSGLGAGGLNVIGGMYSCVLTGGTAICSNTTSNVDGPYLIEGSVTVCDCLADLTHDGAVNGGDLGVLLSNWGLTLPSGAGDVNHDGVVNAADLALLLGSWGVCN
jgi:hypothetical protein